MSKTGEARAFGNDTQTAREVFCAICDTLFHLTMNCQEGSEKFSRLKAAAATLSEQYHFD